MQKTFKLFIIAILFQIPAVEAGFWLGGGLGGTSSNFNHSFYTNTSAPPSYKRDLGKTVAAPHISAGYESHLSNNMAIGFDIMCLFHRMNPAQSYNNNDISNQGFAFTVEDQSLIIKSDFMLQAAFKIGRAIGNATPFFLLGTALVPLTLTSSTAEGNRATQNFLLYNQKNTFHKWGYLMGCGLSVNLTEKQSLEFRYTFVGLNQIKQTIRDIQSWDRVGAQYVPYRGTLQNAVQSRFHTVSLSYKWNCEL